MGCPSETTLGDFLGGALREERRALVLTHMEGCADCQRALAAGASSLPEPLSPGEPGAELAPGATLSRYVVLERIGQGSMGVVYAARDPELERRVAIKVLRPEGRQVEELRRRLLREAQALARLSDPHVVAVHDVGTCGDGIFVAMDLVEGTTLAEWLRQPRSWREVLHVFVEAGRGLVAAHRAGLVHRDFKPANVLVGRDGRVRVTDFGLACSVDQSEASGEAASSRESLPVEEEAELTRTGALLGTPAYMAPEQLQGHKADALSDQFSFCVALYEALHGERPFQGTSLEELGRAARDGQVRPARRDTRVPAWLRRVVLRGLRPRPEERFPSMEALLEALTSCPRRARLWVAGCLLAAAVLGVGLQVGAVHRREVRCAQEVERLDAAWSPQRRERAHAAFLANGKPFALSAWERSSRELDAYAAQWRTLRAEACMAIEEGDTSTSASQTAVCLDARLWQLAAVTDVLERADSETIQRAQHLVASLEGLAACKDAPASALRPQPPDALRPRVDAVRRKLAEARVRLDAGRYSEGLVVTASLLQEIQGLDYRPLEAEVLVTHGQLQGLGGKLKDAEESFYRALWAAEAGRDDEMTARVWIFLIWAVGDQAGRAEDAERVAQHARAAVERLGRERFPAMAADLGLRLGVMLLGQDRLEQADAELSRGLELSSQSRGPDSVRTSYFVSSLGRVRTRQHRHAEALALFRQAQELRERVWGTEHPALALNLNNIAISLLELGRREEAVATWRRSLALLEATRPADHPSFAAPLNNLAAVQRSLGQLDEARRNLERALAIFERSKGKDHPNTATVLNELGRVAQDSQRLDEARAYLEEALQRVQRALGPDTPRAASPLASLGEVHLLAGRYEEARRDLTRALRLWEKESGSEAASVTAALRPLARLELATGSPGKALEDCERALQVDARVQGEQSPDVALDLACLGEAHLARSAPEQAVPLLERARLLHLSAPRDPLDAAWASFLLARALTERGEAPDRARATELAEEARTRMEGLGLRARMELRQVMAWRRGETP
ncbi:tetratricopeptide repeat protein [Archangium violaceum]|uniref:tetratricopeptide repeat protein n=1 Tax=Archangium violaceum TaxID=83451 RepID=UPI001952A000|nr:tetratricopeptide repeat protein [Archangium violaceum]QRN93861.1 tetratricopeptide repeat protein [Archangium violaceum]